MKKITLLITLLSLTFFGRAQMTQDARMIVKKNCEANDIFQNNLSEANKDIFRKFVSLDNLQGSNHTFLYEKASMFEEFSRSPERIKNMREVAQKVKAKVGENGFKEKYTGSDRIAFLKECARIAHEEQCLWAEGSIRMTLFAELMQEISSYASIYGALLQKESFENALSADTKKYLSLSGSAKNSLELIAKRAEFYKDKFDLPEGEEKKKAIKKMDMEMVQELKNTLSPIIIRATENIKKEETSNQKLADLKAKYDKVTFATALAIALRRMPHKNCQIVGSYLKLGTFYRK